MKIDAIPLLAGLQRELLDLLRSLTPEDWLRPTACPGWTVHDLAAHLLDGSLRRLSICRDGWSAESPQGDLGAFLNRLNHTWVQAARRLSPALLIDLHESIGPQVIDYWRSLDPLGKAAFPVAWAGETESQVWFDCARDYTEFWHHQQQIREAVGAEPLTHPRWFHPFLAILMCAVPVSYQPHPGARVNIHVEGDAGGYWGVADGRLYSGSLDRSQALIAIPQRDCWLLFTKKLPPEQAISVSRIFGDIERAKPFFHTRAVMG